jgi:hypothetical protein
MTLEVLPAAVDVALPGARVAGQLVDQVLTELPALGQLQPREQLLTAAWPLSYRSARTLVGLGIELATVRERVVHRPEP